MAALWQRAATPIATRGQEDCRTTSECSNGKVMPLQATNVLKTLTELDSLNDLERFVNSQSEKPLRRILFTLFDDRAEYRNARDWAEVVRICEALAIIGWGKRERVDAICERQENQWQTQFLAANGDYRFLNGNWTKRKAGFQLHNPEYYVSPDRPDKPAVDWKTYGRLHSAEFQIVPCDSLPTQRNKRRLSPIALGGIGGMNLTTNVVEEHRMELYRRLRTSIPRNRYGDGLETFDMCFVSADWDGKKLKPRLQLGRYTPKSQLYRCYLEFEPAFRKRSRPEQMEYIATNLLTALDHLAGLLRQKSVAYDMAALRSDVARVLATWQASPQ